MKEGNIFYVGLVLLFLNYLCSEITADQPCAARSVTNRSVICVCNTTYCDETTRQVPCNNQFIAYTTSAAGSRFKTASGYFQSSKSSCGNGEYLLNLDVSKTYQTIQGFGGAVTDAAAINWRSLPKNMQQSLIESYYGKCGLEYNIARIPIGCSDFSTRRYTYADSPDDNNLEKFSLQEEDYEYKIVMMKEINKVATEPVWVVASSWTPPSWMKYFSENNIECGFLKKEHYQTYAQYLLKFMENYDNQGISIRYLTTSNEPSLATFPHAGISCLGWSTKDMGDWIVNNLGPTIRNSIYKDVNILALDDQRYTVKSVFEQMVQNNSKVLDVVDGLAVHYYSDSYVSPEVCTHASDKYKKFIISTEACAGLEAKGVVLGAWKNAKKYIKDLIQDLTHEVVGWVDWNLVLDKQGGPNVDKNYVDAPIIVDIEKKEFYKQPMYYALGHITKFIPRGSVRIGSSAPPCSCSIANVAFLTPRNTIVVVLHNTDDASSVTIKNGENQATISLEADSITTVEFLNE